MRIELYIFNAQVLDLIITRAQKPQKQQIGFNQKEIK